MSGTERRRRRLRRTSAIEPATETPRAPSPYDLADLAGPFALTATVHDLETTDDLAIRDADTLHVDTLHAGDETPTERGLRGLVGGGSSQVGVTAALRARD